MLGAGLRQGGICQELSSAAPPLPSTGLSTTLVPLMKSPGFGDTNQTHSWVVSVFNQTAKKRKQLPAKLFQACKAPQRKVFPLHLLIIPFISVEGTQVTSVHLLHLHECGWFYTNNSFPEICTRLTKKTKTNQTKWKLLI